MRFLKLLSFTLMLSILGLLPAFGEDEVYKTALFGSDYNANNSSYTGSFDATNGTFVVTAVNFNNNNNGWTNSSGLGQIKCGRKNNASVGTITTKAVIDKAVTKVVVTVDAFTSGKVNSFKLYVASNAAFTENLQEVIATIKTGTNEFPVTTPAANCYYKIAVDCASGSSNGLVTISKVEYYKEKAVAPGTCETPTFTPAAGSYEGTQSVTISCETDGTTIYYTTDGTAPSTSSSVYSTPISVSADMTVKAYAVREGLTDSEVAEAAYTITKAPDVVLNLLDGNWEFPTSSSTTTKTYTNSESGYKVSCYAADGYYVNSSNYFIIGKANSYILLPKFDNAIDKIVVVGNSGGSGKVIFGIYDDDVAVSTTATGCTSDKTFVITDPEPEKQYAIKVTSDHNLQMKQIKIYFGAAPAVAKPTITGDENFLTSTEVSIACSTEGAAIYYTTEASLKDEPSTETWIAYDNNNKPTFTASTTIYAAAKKESDWSSVNKKTFTKIVPITVDVAIAAIPNVDDEVNDQYVQGIVCTAATSVSGGKMTYYISIDGSATNRLQIYNGKNLNNTNFTNVSDLAIGDRVVVFGQLKNYKGTPEMNDGNYLVLKEAPAVAAPEFSPDGGGFMGEKDVTITCATEGSTIYYTLDGTTPSKSSNVYSAAIHLDATTTITAIAYVGDEKSLVITKTFTLTAPMTVAEALVALDSQDPIDNVAVTGIISTAPTSNPSGGKLTYHISDDGTNTDELEVFAGFGLNGASFSDKTDLQVGDEVIVFGNLTIYNSTTKEFSTGSRLLTFNRPTVAMQGVTLPATAGVRAGKTITLTPTFNPTNATNKNVTWNVTAGSTYADVDANGVVTGKAEGTATIQVETEDGGFTASCTVTVLAGVNFADGDWMLVTDAAELTANSYVIIAAAADYGKAMKPYESGNNCKSKDATKSGSMLTYDSDFGVFEIKAGNKENTIALSDVDNGSYLYAASSSNNYLKAEETLSNNSSWAVDVTSAGMATLIAQGNYTRNILKYNSVNDQLLFSCYASSSTNMKDIALYKYYAPVPKVIYNKNTDDEVTNMPGVTRAELEGEVYKATISTTVPHRSGYSFSGWKSGETTYNAGEKYTLTADITLNAQWTQLVGHHVTYVATGTAPTDENLYYEGDKVTLALATGVSDPGYSFAGWNDGTNTYTAGYEEYVMPDNDVTFTAVWSRMSSQKWALVEDVNNIKTDGTEYIIVATGYDVAMSALSGKIYSTSDVIKNENTKTLTGPESMLKLTFETDLGSSKLAIKNGSKYISSTEVKEMTEGDDSFNWEISITDGVATISASVGNIRYNKDHPRFTTYASGQQDVALYVKVPMVEISTDVEASALSENTDVVVHSNGTLTVDNDKTLGDLTVENGGKVVLSNKKLTVTNFVIETTMADHKSGQVDGALTTNFEAMGDAYIDITLGAGGTDQQWHAFTVPFPVDVLNGIFDLADNKLQNEVNYAIMDYHGDIRATGKYGWKKIRTTLVPGTFYIMATDGYRTTYRFKKKDGAALVAENSMSYSQYAESEAGVYGIDNGWNGIGNPNLFYGKVNLPVQVLNPATYTYEPYVGKDANSTNFIVGTPFFYQASGDGSIVMQPASGTTNYAPARYTMPKEIKDVEVRFGNEEYTDRLYISANEDALSTYETGKDLIKMTMTNTPKVAQIFGCAYDTKLCMVNAPLRNDQANFSLKLYAPADGEYTITIPEVDNADIYLTYDNRIIWNIAASEYTCELKAGEANNYGLILRMKAPQVTTGVEQGGVSNGANSVQKIIINDHVYILRGEKLYDVTGKMLR